MPRRYYLSTRKDRAEHALILVNALQTAGWERTFDWSESQDFSPDNYAETAAMEIRAVQEADVLVVLLPGGYGTHVEIGAALVLGKRVIIHAPNRTILNSPYPCVFHYHPLVDLLISETLDVDDIVARLPG